MRRLVRRRFDRDTSPDDSHESVISSSDSLASSSTSTVSSESGKDSSSPAVDDVLVLACSSRVSHLLQRCESEERSVRGTIEALQDRLMLRHRSLWVNMNLFTASRRVTPPSATACRHDQRRSTFESFGDLRGAETDIGDIAAVASSSASDGTYSEDDMDNSDNRNHVKEEELVADAQLSCHEMARRNDSSSDRVGASAVREQEAAPTLPLPQNSPLSPHRFSIPHHAMASSEDSSVHNYMRVTEGEPAAGRETLHRAWCDMQAPTSTVVVVPPRERHGAESTTSSPISSEAAYQRYFGAYPVPESYEQRQRRIAEHETAVQIQILSARLDYLQMHRKHLQEQAAALAAERLSRWTLCWHASQRRDALFSLAHSAVLRMQLQFESTGVVTTSASSFATSTSGTLAGGPGAPAPYHNRQQPSTASALPLRAAGGFCESATTAPRDRWPPAIVLQFMITHDMATYAIPTFSDMVCAEIDSRSRRIEEERATWALLMQRQNDALRVFLASFGGSIYGSAASPVPPRWPMSPDRDKAASSGTGFRERLFMVSSTPTASMNRIVSSTAALSLSANDDLSVVASTTALAPPSSFAFGRPALIAPTVLSAEPLSSKVHKVLSPPSSARALVDEQPTASQWTTTSASSASFSSPAGGSPAHGLRRMSMTFVSPTNTPTREIISHMAAALYQKTSQTVTAVTGGAQREANVDDGSVRSTSSRNYDGAAAGSWRRATSLSPYPSVAANHSAGRSPSLWYGPTPSSVSTPLPQLPSSRAPMSYSSQRQSQNPEAGSIPDAARGLPFIGIVPSPLPP